MEISKELKVGDLVQCWYSKAKGIVVRVQLERTHTLVWVLWAETGKTLLADEDGLVKIKPGTDNNNQ